MNRPRSVLERDPDEVASMMMASARREQPPAQLRLHVISAIGGAGVAGTAASAASATVAATAIAGTTATSAKLLMAAPLMLAVKWGVVGVAAGLVTVGVSERAAHVDRPSDGSNGTLVISASDRNRSKQAPVEPNDRTAMLDEIAPPNGGEQAAPGGPSTVPNDPSRSKIATVGAKVLVPAPNASEVARQHERAEPTAAASPSSEPPAAPGVECPSLGSLGAEVAILDEARTALAGHDPARALRAIESYERTFSTGRLLTEATALRIEAHVANHEPAVAEAVGQRFLAANPRGPLANRVRGLLNYR